MQNTPSSSLGGTPRSPKAIAQQKKGCCCGCWDWLFKSKPEKKPTALYRTTITKEAWGGNSLSLTPPSDQQVTSQSSSSLPQSAPKQSTISPDIKRAETAVGHSPLSALSPRVDSDPSQHQVVVTSTFCSYTPVTYPIHAGMLERRLSQVIRDQQFAAKK